ncbi:hypothetical protein [Aeromonas media]|uniref:hypothetical protein n=1 Tax=Aeromonas media TaxID=651 RepID=UPI002282D4C7|nr:hypothetical protein [Aeromonas media]MCY9822478.1 hypothetical protein [Aeromonas media]
MKLPRKNKRGPIAGKPKPYMAEVVKQVNQGYSQSQIADIWDPQGREADFPRKIRRIIRGIEDASLGGVVARRIYESGINTKEGERLHIYSLDYSAHKWRPDLAEYRPPALLTKGELFHALDEAQRTAIEAIKKLCPEGSEPVSCTIDPDHDQPQPRKDKEG